MSIEERLGIEVAGKYDDAIRRAAFGYDSLHEMIPSLLKRHLPDRVGFLVVGAGTGIEISTFGDSPPD